MVEDLAQRSFELETERAKEACRGDAREVAEDELARQLIAQMDACMEEGEVEETERRALLRRLRLGELDETDMSLETDPPPDPGMTGGGGGAGDLPPELKRMMASLEHMMPPPPDGAGGRRSVRMSVRDARERLTEDAVAKIVAQNEGDITDRALQRAQQDGIIFIDEIDKLCSGGSSRSTSSGGGGGGSGGGWHKGEGVQKELLSLIEGCSVSTRLGVLNTDHVLFIAAGAFHQTAPADLLPELQGRLPVRVTLDPLEGK
jgi:ATP-dependent HslUV protease ATP-binding subunit HslU